MNRNLRAIKWFLKSYLDYDRPVYGSFKVTHRCNMQCPFCNVWKDRTPDLPTKDIFKIIDRLAESTVTVLSLEGGEPTLRKDILEIVKYAHDRSFYLFMTTNGTLLHKLPLEEFAKYLDFLHVSIDEGHNNLYLFDELKKYTPKIKITVQTVVTKNDVKAMRWKVEKAYEAGARILLMPAVALPGAINMSPDKKEIHDELEKLKKEFGSTIVTSQAFIDSLVNHYTCKSFSVMIEANGDIVYPCSVIGWKVGNLLESKLEDILLSEEAKKAREAMYRCRRECMLYLHAETSQFNNIFNLGKYALSTIAGYMRR
ncbi:MAG: radical SAM protein [Thermoplasmata archaeon]|nr:radical SAM protein [Thermoplasmata archaeon]